MSDARLHEVRAIAAHVPALQSKDVTVTELGGGLTNRNYRVDAGGGSYVVRIAGTGTELLGIDREREVACSHAAAGAGVASAVVAHLPEHHATIMCFVHGRQLSADDVCNPEVLRRLAEALRRCHDYPAPPDLGVFSPFATIRTYHALATERHVPMPADVERALELLACLEAELQALRSDEEPCLCHNDLLPANFLDDGTTIYLIDWEYGGLGDRFFDLGNFAVNNGLDDEQERAFLEAYFGEARDDDLRRLRKMRLVSDLREAMWGYLQAGVSTLHPPAYYLEYGRKHLDRFLGAAGTLLPG